MPGSIPAKPTCGRPALTPEDLLQADALLTPGDLLFTRYNGKLRFVGACAVVPPDAQSLMYPDQFIRVRVPALRRCSSGLEASTALL
jgi:hypothetical protein